MSKTLAKEIELKKKNRLKESGSINVLLTSFLLF